jgi:aspartate ammonia-lyase
VEVNKVASDLRLLSMGPRAGIAEVQLPPVQPGSSIMPGKVNPSVPEMVNQVCYQVFGCDATVLAASDAGQLELNVMMPVIAWNTLHATRILGNAMQVLDSRCVRGIRADEARGRELLDRSTAVATALSPYIGYAETADIAKTAVRTGRSIREIVRERGLLDDTQLEAILAVEAMTTPGVPGENRETRDTTKATPGRAVGGPRGSAAVGGRGRTTATARTTGPAAGPGTPRGSGPGRVAASRTDHGSPANRRGKRRR